MKEPNLTVAVCVENYKLTRLARMWDCWDQQCNYHQALILECCLRADYLPEKAAKACPVGQLYKESHHLTDCGPDIWNKNSIHQQYHMLRLFFQISQNNLIQLNSQLTQPTQNIEL
jgi:hypothetical protein